MQFSPTSKIFRQFTALLLTFLLTLAWLPKQPTGTAQAFMPDNYWAFTANGIKLSDNSLCIAVIPQFTGVG